jgi:hypothetical protein
VIYLSKLLEALNLGSDTILEAVLKVGCRFDGMVPG